MSEVPLQVRLIPQGCVLKTPNEGSNRAMAPKHVSTANPTRTAIQQHECNQCSVFLGTRGEGGHARLVLCEPGSEAVLAAAEKRVPAPEPHRRRRPAYDALALHGAPLPGEQERDLY